MLRKGSVWRRVSSKWLKTQSLLNNPETADYVPETVLYSNDALKQMLGKYNMIYVKPTMGAKGAGVIRVKRLDAPSNNDNIPDQSGEAAFTYYLTTSTGSSHHRSLEDLHLGIKPYMKRKGYLIQKGIQMLRNNGRMFDLRIVVQMSSAHKWKASGMLGRVAKRGKIVTNGSQGATIMPASKLLKPYFHDETAQILRKLYNIALLSAKQLEQTFPGIKEIGIDVAIDDGLTPWILEANTGPEVIPFSKLRNKTMYHRILSRRRAYH